MLRVCDLRGRYACVRNGVFYTDNYSVAVIAIISAVQNEWGVYYTLLRNNGMHCGIFVDNNIPIGGRYRAFVDNNIPIGGRYRPAAFVDHTLSGGWAV